MRSQVILAVTFVSFWAAGLASPAQACQSSISPNSSINGSWTSSCQSTHRSGRYARFYTFTLSSSSTVQIDLTSSVDSYLYLLNGSRTTSSVLSLDDDGGGNNNARISRSLAAGTYTIEATTYSSGRTGNFTLRIQATSSAGPCLTAANLNASTAGSWSSSCLSTHRSGSYSRYFTFSIAQAGRFQADLSSSTVDSYLYLMTGSGTTGTVIAQDDDGGEGNNSRIVRDLTPGVYTIEATTYSSGRSGSFALGLSFVNTSASCILPLGLNASTAGSWATDCQSTHRSGRYARYYTFSLSSPGIVEMNLSSTAADSYLYLLQGAGTTGIVLAQDDDSAGSNNSRIRMTLQAGSYTLEATTYSSGQTGSFVISAGIIGSANKTTVFLIHGLRQSSSAMDSLRQTLSSADFGIDTNRFQIDSGFNWSECASNPDCGTTCTVGDGGRALARYINSRNPTGPIVLVGYSLGGLIAREMILGNYEGVLNNRSVAALITLGTPNVGYPFCEVDINAVCPLLAVEMASHYRVRQDENVVVVSTYLQNMVARWGASSFTRMPPRWLAAAGTFCSDDRFCEWNDIHRSVDQGCRDNDSSSDGVVCKNSALYEVQAANRPTATWQNSSYAHVDNRGSWLVMCGNNGSYHNLFNPPASGSLVQRIRSLINGL